MEKSTLHIKTKENYEIFKLEIYNIKDDIIGNDDNYLKNIIDFKNIEHLDLKLINNFINNINKRIKSIVLVDSKFLFRMYKKIYFLKTNNDIDTFIKTLKEENDNWIIKSTINNRLKKINKSLKEKHLKTITDLNEDINIDLIDKVLESKGEIKLTQMVETFKEKDIFNELMSNYKDLFLVIFINKIVSLYYEIKINNFFKDQLEEMIKRVSKNDISLMNEIFKSINNKENIAFKNYCKKIIDYTIYTAYSKELKNKCWNEKCCNASKCNRITSCDMDIRNYSYITDGIMFIDEKNHIERSIVLDCSRYKKSNYVVKDIPKEDNKLAKPNEETRSAMRYRLANMTSQSKGLRFTENMYTELTEKEKLNMLSMKEREELRRNLEMQTLKVGRDKLLNSNNTLESDKPKTKKMINNLKKLD